MKYFNTQPKQLLEAAHFVLSMDNGYVSLQQCRLCIDTESAGSAGIWKRIISASMQKLLMKPFNPFNWSDMAI